LSGLCAFFVPGIKPGLFLRLVLLRALVWLLKLAG
jgi:hypothetical protein